MPGEEKMVYLLSVIMGNRRPLPKIEELWALTSLQRESWECSLMCFTEIGLLVGFQLVTADRKPRESCIGKEDGIASFVNDREAWGTSW